MKTLQIIHLTEYLYKEPVRFGTHVAMMRPREGHDLHILGASLKVDPDFQLQWVRDIYGNSIAILTFPKPAEKLRILSDVTVELYDDEPIQCLVDPSAQLFPFHYCPDEKMEIIPYCLPAYPADDDGLLEWVREKIYRPGDLVNTLELLAKLNTAIFESFQYVQREEPGVQPPSQTLALGSGSCRDFTVYFVEAARALGFAARFVTGYILMGAGQHGATHAWAEVYIPGTGWRGYDPTNNKPAGLEHVSVAVARDAHKASPLAGTWMGTPGAFEQMNVSVQVVSR